MKSLGPYRIDRPLGAGGMGKVFAATLAAPRHGLPAGAVVALKIVHPHLLEDAGVLRRFLREAEVGRAIDHRNVVRTYDADEIEADGVRHHVLVMEYVEGQTLRALLGELGTVPEELCRHVGREIARGLAAIHAAGAVHRDLKPENVLITRDRDLVQVMDLGVARIAEESARLSSSGAFVGSVQYAAPEQFRAEDSLDGRADLFTLGVVLYELATGRHPFEAGDFRRALRRILDETPRPCGELNPQLSPFYEEVVRTLLAKDRAQRFATADEVASVLDEGEDSEWWRLRSTAIRAATQRPLRRIRVPRETSLYGREAELARLRSIFERAASGDGSVVLIEGEAGIGKSRLVDEFVGALVESGEDVNYLFGSFPPGGAATAVGAYASAWREHLGDANLTDALEAYLPETPLLVPAFAALLRGDAPPEGAEPLGPDSLRSVLVHALRRLSAERPTILLVDDLHFAPEEGRSLFASLAVSVPGQRVLLVGTARPELDEEWAADLEHVGATRIALQRLGPKDLVRLLADSLKSEPLAEELAGRIAVTSDGNPFFVFEILRGLRERGFLERDGRGTWASTRAIREIEVPTNIVELVHARLGELAEEDRDLLDVAACCGFEFDPLLAAAVLDVPQIPAMKRLARIERRHRLVRCCGRRYVFDHHQVQDAIYRGMPELLREPYHAAIGAALEARSGAATREVSSLDGPLCVDLASHFLRGAQGARALRYLDAALRHLEGAYRNEAAADLADRALAVPGLVAGADRCRLLLRKAARLEFLGRATEERTALDEAVVVADATGEPELRARSRVSLGAHLAQSSRNQDAEVVLRDALTIARGSGRLTVEASASRTLGRTLRFLARYDEARPLFERSLALAREAGDGRAEAVAEGSLGNIAWLLGRFDEARAHFERHLEIGRALRLPQEEAAATGNLGILALSHGDFDEARARLERAVTLSKEIGSRRGEAISTGNLGATLRELGRWREARACFERRLALARETGHPQGEAQANGHLAALARDSGDRAGARAAIEASLRICRATADARLENSALLDFAELQREEGDLAAAERTSETVLDVRRRIGDRPGVADALLHVGALRADLGRIEEARRCFEEVAALARELGTSRGIASAACRIACLPGGDPAAARAALAAHEQRLGVADRMELRFLLWKSAGERSDLEEARRDLVHLVTHVEPERRAAMLSEVRTHREVVAACRAEGLPPPG